MQHSASKLLKATNLKANSAGFMQGDSYLPPIPIHQTKDTTVGNPYEHECHKQDVGSTGRKRYGKYVEGQMRNMRSKGYNK